MEVGAVGEKVLELSRKATQGYFKFSWKRELKEVYFGTKILKSLPTGGLEEVELHITKTVHGS